MPINAQTWIQQALSHISAAGDSVELAHANETFRAAFLAFASATPDNMVCFESIAVAPFVTNAFTSWAGLVSHGIPLSSILNAAEGCAVPETVLADFPTLQQADWDAALRVATVILAAFQSSADNLRPPTA